MQCTEGVAKTFLDPMHGHERRGQESSLQAEECGYCDANFTSHVIAHFPYQLSKKLNESANTENKSWIRT